MLDIIAATFPRLVVALRRTGCSRSDAARLILAARFGERATAWCSEDCARARRIIGAAVRQRRARLQGGC
ncbi:MAG: hypothetical protein QOH47_2441 [Sphingomonadales bacterium]|jgi:hypothetical protein|nr:hypothetical protein [Sphingomonadales bacterium]